MQVAEFGSTGTHRGLVPILRLGRHRRLLESSDPDRPEQQLGFPGHGTIDVTARMSFSDVEDP